MVRMLAAAAESLADIFDRSRLGIAMAAMIRIIATTISNSINEKPFCLRILEKSPVIYSAECDIRIHSRPLTLFTWLHLTGHKFFNCFPGLKTKVTHFLSIA